MSRSPILLLLVCGIPTLYPQDSKVKDASASNLLSCSTAGIESLQKWYVPDTGQWRTTGWWNAANATTLLVRYSRLAGSAEVKAAIENTFTRNAAGKFLNQYYDDEGWWALAWIDAYEWSHEARYLAMAEQIFADMTQGWDDTCGGGIWWRKDRRYKNAIANELFLSVAARLATAADPAKRPAYLAWAQREWKWFAASGMINAHGLINDGLTAGCQNNGRNTWTYNQGVILGGLSGLAAATGEKPLVERAQAIALAAITQLTDQDGILHDSCEPKCGADAVQFKGIFARNLGVLNAAAPLPRFRTFLETNAERICRVQTADHQFGVVWSAPSDAINGATQVSALDAILAAAALGR
ncbi:MAG TPA: glycoside hydrolase family 76 protein [Bryobacteraceae bacterium]|nr:glycoside hydrolase family 76 protein [Bryobacteraceae bacterium]